MNEYKLDYDVPVAQKDMITLADYQQTNANLQVPYAQTAQTNTTNSIAPMTTGGTRLEQGM